MNSATSLMTSSPMHPTPHPTLKGKWSTDQLLRTDESFPIMLQHVLFIGESTISTSRQPIPSMKHGILLNQRFNILNLIVIHQEYK